MLAGCLALFAGTAVTLAAIQTASGAAFLVGTALASAGFGPGMLGAFRTISAEATPEHRASLIAAYFIVSYAAFSISGRRGRGGHHRYRPAPHRPGLSLAAAAASPMVYAHRWRPTETKRLTTSRPHGKVLTHPIRHTHQGRHHG